MRIAAMARVTKLSEQTLTELSQSNPVFAPGVDNYVAMGGVRALWRGDLKTHLREALANSPLSDERAADGLARGGRLLAAPVMARVLAAA
jgi:malonate decarboxylase gamma subunit